jgi:hypothetical protein
VGTFEHWRDPIVFAAAHPAMAPIGRLNHSHHVDEPIAILAAIHQSMA